MTAWFFGRLYWIALNGLADMYVYEEEASGIVYVPNHCCFKRRCWFGRIDLHMGEQRVGFYEKCRLIVIIASTK
jgi:hypothetical protein